MTKEELRKQFWDAVFNIKGFDFNIYMTIVRLWDQDAPNCYGLFYELGTNEPYFALYKQAGFMPNSVFIIGERLNEAKLDRAIINKRVQLKQIVIHPWCKIDKTYENRILFP